MKINQEFLDKNHACSLGVKWFLAQKENDGAKVVQALMKDGTPEKLRWANWTIVRLLDKPQCVRYAIYAAEQVIEIFEKGYPTDKRPREAIEAAKEWIKSPSGVTRYAAYDAGDAAYAAAGAGATVAARAADATVAARAAAYAAADAAYAAADATVAVRAADATVAACAAAYAAADAAYAAADAADATVAARAADATVAARATDATDATVAAHAAADAAYAAADAADAADAAGAAAGAARKKMCLKILSYGLELLIKEENKKCLVSPGS